jgi:hypothetical protein
VRKQRAQQMRVRGGATPRTRRENPADNDKERRRRRMQRRQAERGKQARHGVQREQVVVLPERELERVHVDGVDVSAVRRRAAVVVPARRAGAEVWRGQRAEG